MNKRVVMVAIGIGVLCAGLVAYNFIGALLFAGPGFMQPPPTPVETVTGPITPMRPSLTLQTVLLAMRPKTWRPAAAGPEHQHESHHAERDGDPARPADRAAEDHRRGRGP